MFRYPFTPLLLLLLLLILGTPLTSTQSQTPPVFFQVQFDLRQKHVRVPRIQVAQQFINGIESLAAAQLATKYPGLDFALVNGPAPARAGHAWSVAMDTFVLTAAGEEKTTSWDGERTQRNNAAGRATFLVFAAAEGGGKKVKGYDGLLGEFEREYSAIVDGAGDIWPPCELIPDGCMLMEDESGGPWGLGMGL